MSTEQIPAGSVQTNEKEFNTVFMDKLSSVEHYLTIGSQPKPVLQNISLEIKKGEIWAITGSSRFELKLLLEIMANIKPYLSGRCVLMERGMMRLKRKILPHVFYVGNTNMAYNNMNVLEFLMFATANSNFDVVFQQKRIFEQLISFGLGSISLTPISTLTPEYKAIILLLVGIYSSSQLIVMNLPSLKFNQKQITALGEITRYMQSLEKTLVVSALDALLIEKICDHIAYLYDGSIFYKGTTREFRHRYDRIVLTIKDKRAEIIEGKLKRALPMYDYSTNDDTVTVRNYYSDNSSPSEIYEKIVAEGFAPQKIKINPKTVENAFEEILKQNDL